VALTGNVVVLTGGVGGAKLARGLVEVLPPERLSFIVNTGDDFWRLGLKICPDLDTLMYTLADVVNPETGWGLRGDSLITLGSLDRLYRVDPWFRLGDKDLATHLLRSHWLRQGCSLTAVTACLVERLGSGARILPMTDAEMPTLVDTVECGLLGFQQYFVKYGWQPVVRGIKHQDCESARLSDAVLSALLAADAVLIAPSNPWLSLAPILAIPGARDLLARLSAPVVAVTPIIGGAAVKGPTAKIMRELGLEVSARSIADFYQDIIGGFVDDKRNEAFARQGLRITQMDTLMNDLPDKIALARGTLEWIGSWTA